MARGRPPPRSVPQGQPTADDVAGPTGRRHDRDPTGGVGEYEEVLKPAVYRTRSSASTRRRREEGGRQCTTLVGGCLWHLPRASVQDSVETTQKTDQSHSLYFSSLKRRPPQIRFGSMHPCASNPSHGTIHASTESVRGVGRSEGASGAKLGERICLSTNHREAKPLSR